VKITPINRHWFHPKWTISIQKGPRGWKGASTPPIEAAHKRKFICSERREVVRYRCAQASPIPLGRCKSSTITAETRALTGAVFLTGGERGPVRQIALKNKRPPTEAASGLPAKGDNPSMYIPIGSGDQDAAYYERERPSGSYSKSISHLILRAFSDRAHSIDLQRKGSQIVPLSKSRHATSNFKTGQ
jgi:hypothetical protein